LEEVLKDAEVVVIGTRDLNWDSLKNSIRRDQEVIDLVSLEKSRRPQITSAYKGICW
jgi:hypothetical protein